MKSDSKETRRLPRSAFGHMQPFVRPGVASNCGSDGVPRDARKIEDVDSSAADHAADATRYSLNWERNRIRAIKIEGMY